MKTSPLFQRVVLILAALAVLGTATWAGLRFFEPVSVPLIPPPKPHVTFDPKADIRKNPFWSGLFPVFNDDIEPGALGRTNPFAAIGIISTSTQGVPSGLGTVREVTLNGGGALALAPSGKGGMLVLTVTSPVSGGQTYDIRRYTPATAPVNVADWSVPSSVGPGPSTTPVAIREDGSGTVWVLFANGALTSIQPNGAPDVHSVIALASANTVLAPLFGDVRVDGAGRLWVTDGVSVAEGEGTTFTPVDMPAQLSDVDRASLGLTGSETPDDLANLFRPWRFEARNDGRMAVISSKFTASFPMDLRARPDILAASSTESILGMSVQGAVWSALLDSSANVRGMVRHDPQGGVHSFLDPVVLPKQVVHNGFLMDGADRGLAALDYTSNGTTLWLESGGSWLAQTLAPVGSQPPDTARHIAMDGQGNVWAILNQKGLLLVTPPSM